MPKIRFTRAYRVKPNGPDYAEGQVVEVSEPSAQHFINRQAAVPAGDDEPPAPARPAAHRPAGGGGAAGGSKADESRPQGR